MVEVRKGKQFVNQKMLSVDLHFQNPTINSLSGVCTRLTRNSNTKLFHTNCIRYAGQGGDDDEGVERQDERRQAEH
jgi:hypothetical protein